MQVTGWLRILGRSSESEVLVRDMMLRYPVLRLVFLAAEADRGRYEVARQLLGQIYEEPSLLYEPFTHSLLCLLAELCSIFGTLEMAKWLYEQLLPEARLWGNIGFGLNTYGPIGRQLGMLAIRIGDIDSAEQHLGAALASSEAANSPTFISLTCVVYARALIKRQTAAARQRAQEMLVRSEAVNRPRGWNGLSNYARYLAARAEITLPEIDGSSVQ
jgi:hypothetical protein